MLFWLVTLGVILGWVEAVYGKPAEQDGRVPDVTREVGGSSTAERRLRVTPHPADAGSNPVPPPLPDIPYFLAAFPRRTSPEPVAEPDDTPLLADAYVRLRVK